MWDTGHWVVLFSMSHASHRKYWPLPVPASIKAPGKDNIMGMDHMYISFYQSHFTSQQEWHINSLSIPNIHTSFWFYIPSLQRFWIVSLEVLNGEREEKTDFSSVLLLEPLAEKNLNIFPFISHPGRIIFQILTITRSLKANLILKKKKACLRIFVNISLFTSFAWMSRLRTHSNSLQLMALGSLMKGC